MLPWLADEEVILFYEHDPLFECGIVKRNEKGGFESGEKGTLAAMGLS